MTPQEEAATRRLVNGETDLTGSAFEALAYIEMLLKALDTERVAAATAEAIAHRFQRELVAERAKVTVLETCKAHLVASLLAALEEGGAMAKRLTSEREAEIREWAVGYLAEVAAQTCAPVKEADWVVDLLAELDAVRGERDERESLLGAYETAVGDVNTARDLQAKVAALREKLEMWGLLLDKAGVTIMGEPWRVYLRAALDAKEE